VKFAFTPALLGPRLLAWYLERRRPLPWRVLWQRHRDPYHVWISEIMLQQTVIKAVLPVYDRFLAAFPTVQDLAKADEESVRTAVRGLGYYRRFRMMHEAAKVISARGDWPSTYEGWKELPGIGDYTASAISSIAFDYPAAVVDGNVERVFCRLLDIREAPNQPHLKKAFKKLAQELLVEANPGDFNQALMELGQTVCTTSAKPACDACPLAEGCLSLREGSQALAPAPKAKPEMVDVAMRLLIVEGKKGIGLIERSAASRFLKGSWGFFDGDLQKQLVAKPRALGKVRHNITRHKIEARVEAVELDAKDLVHFPALRWLQKDEVEAGLMANLDRKAWKLYLGAR
jgi:A/G-specific adenine glycosylase